MRLEPFLRDHGIAFEKHNHSTAYTAQQLAHAEHVSGYMVAKPVVVKGRTGFSICAIPAPEHLNLKLAAKALNEPDLRLASESEMAELFPECELGAEPPLGTLFGMKTVVDSKLHEDDFVIMQAGTHTDAITIRREDWERACRPIIARISGGA